MIRTQERLRSELLPLLRDLNELKRIRPAPSGRSLAEIGFLRAWASLAAGCDPDVVARAELDTALVASRLAGADEALLMAGGLAQSDADRVCATARATALERSGAWRDVLGEVVDDPDGTGPVGGEAPGFADLLARQPRAPATRADRPRLSVEPPENHAEHCYVVAVTGVVMAVTECAPIGDVFVAALGHHLHNAWLPDGGFAGEEALGDHLGAIVTRFRADALAQLPPPVAAVVDRANGLIVDETTAAGRAFHAADVVDRVLQTHHHADVAAFTVAQAMDELGLVHEGPQQRYHREVLAEVGL